MKFVCTHFYCRFITVPLLFKISENVLFPGNTIKRSSNFTMSGLRKINYTNVQKRKKKYTENISQYFFELTAENFVLGSKCQRRKYST